MTGENSGKKLHAYFPSNIRIDTTNPPGNELDGALFLKFILDREGIPSEILDREEVAHAGQISYISAIG